jgi:hypothetical protein
MLIPLMKLAMILKFICLHGYKHILCCTQRNASDKMLKLLNIFSSEMLEICWHFPTFTAHLSEEANIFTTAEYYDILLYSRPLLLLNQQTIVLTTSSEKAQFNEFLFVFP